MGYGYPEEWTKLDLRLVWWRRLYPQTQRKVLPSLSDASDIYTLKS